MRNTRQPLRLLPVVLVKRARLIEEPDTSKDASPVLKAGGGRRLPSPSQQYPEKSGAEIRELVEMYVSAPSSNPRTPPPHTTGGAIDITILGPDGPLNMGPNGHQAEAATSFYRGRIGPPTVHDNRRLLYTVMVEVGFTNYPREWWHYDYGDQFWGHLSQRDAIYGLAEK